MHTLTLAGVSGSHFLSLGGSLVMARRWESLMPGGAATHPPEREVRLPRPAWPPRQVYEEGYPRGDAGPARADLIADQEAPVAGQNARSARNGPAQRPGLASAVQR
ncbi:hypothetical protein [Nonomuraea sp. NPDC049141]|uniref:hypothetical protein n=1 Tax=unclassified Nonomuraea TaxID=2593643 RepID=UPI0033F92657